MYFSGILAIHFVKLHHVTEFKYVVIVSAAKEFTEYNHITILEAWSIVPILYLSASRGFDEPSINPLQSESDLGILSLLFFLANWMVNHGVQLQDSPLPRRGSIVNFLTARRHTTHITYFSTATSFERVHG